VGLDSPKLLFKNYLVYFGVGYGKARQSERQMNFGACTVNVSDDRRPSDINKESQANPGPEFAYRAKNRAATQRSAHSHWNLKNGPLQLLTMKAHFPF
jgi:hypothetical protein